ncbi:MAG: Smr/MutS family protein [Myxococcota bacterium]
MARKPKPFNNPFAEAEAVLRGRLKAERKARRKAQAAEVLSASAASPAEEQIRRDASPGGSEDAALFLDSMSDVQPLSGRLSSVQPQRPPPLAATEIPVYDEDAEAYAELASLVDGKARFDISDSDEFIEGCVEGLDRRILQKLRRGEFAFRSHLDLHGMTRQDAREAVERFLWQKREEKHRAVLIVHGRGLNSKDNIPVLKEALLGWLQRGRISRCVLAFATARPHDGGAGAMYVLLRR